MQNIKIMIKTFIVVFVLSLGVGAYVLYSDYNSLSEEEKHKVNDRISEKFDTK